MAKSEHATFRLDKNVIQALEEYQEQSNCEDKTAACEELLRAGLQRNAIPHLAQIKNYFLLFAIEFVLLALGIGVIAGYTTLVTPLAGFYSALAFVAVATLLITVAATIDHYMSEWVSL